MQIAASDVLFTTAVIKVCGLLHFVHTPVAPRVHGSGGPILIHPLEFVYSMVLRPSPRSYAVRNQFHTELYRVINKS